MTPKQEYAECSSGNPLSGQEKDITVRVDNQDPVVACGFHDIHQNNPFAHIDAKNFFHYSTQEDDIDELEISSFFYKVTVSGIFLLEENQTIQNYYHVHKYSSQQNSLIFLCSLL